MNSLNIGKRLLASWLLFTLIFLAATGTWSAIRPVCTLRAPQIPINRYAIFTIQLSHSLGHSCAKRRYKLLYIL